MLVFFLLFSCQSTKEVKKQSIEIPKKVKKNVPIKKQLTAKKPLNKKNNNIKNIQKSKLENKILDKTLNDKISSMSLEEKVGQLFILDFRYEHGKGITKIDSYIRSVLKYINPSGIILFSENIDNLDQLVNIINEYKNSSKEPLFISIDEEGGLVSRIGSKNIGFSHIPSADLVGKTDIKTVKKLAQIQTSELKILGFNLDFSPVGDVYINKLNQVLKKRTYSNNYKIVDDFTSAYIDVFNKNKLISVIKHFPGHGGTKEDSHKQLAILNYPLDTLKKREFIPFKDAIKHNVPMIMIGHISIPSLNPNLPATLSKNVIDILRNDFKYNGVLITDAMDMKAVLSFENAYVRAINAGIDIILSPLNKTSAFDQVLDACKKGKISQKRLDESVKRILKLKYLYKINNDLIDIKKVKSYFPFKEHQEYIKNIKNKNIP